MNRRQELVISAYKAGNKEAQQAIADGNLDLAEALLGTSTQTPVIPSPAPKHMPAKEKAPVKPAAKVTPIKTPVKETPEQELARLREENAKLKAKKNGHVYLKVSEKGAVSVYGLGRFPVTLYKEQMIKLLDEGNNIREFITEHDDELKTKQD